MNQEIKISTVLLLLLFFGGLLTAKFWASSASKSIAGFSYIHQHPDGNSFIKFNNKLFGFDQAGQHTKTIDLTRFQIQENSQTDFSFFSNGDLLVRLNVRESNFIRNLQRYFRFTNLTNKTTEDDRYGLFRCRVETAVCLAFTEQALNLNDAFSLTIDWPTDRVVIADSSRHQVYLFSSEGIELDSATVFRFPNQVRIENQQLYVADTNHHRLVAFDLSEDIIGEITEQFDTRTEDSRALREVWPSSFMLLPEQRWVINSDDSMSFGGIYIFDDQGQFSKKLDLPEAIDLIAIQQLGEQVLVADFSVDRLYRYNLDGEFLGEFEAPALKLEQERISKRRDYYDRIENLFSILFGLFLAVGFLWPFYQQYRQRFTIT